MEEHTSQIHSVESKANTLKETMGILNSFIEGKRKELEIIKVSALGVLDDTSRMMRQKFEGKLIVVMKI